MTIPWIQAGERAVGRNDPSYADVVNRPLRYVLSQSGYDPDAAAFPGIPLIDVALDSALHIQKDDEGVTSAHLSNPHYVFVGESEDAVIGLFSAREGDHGSGIDLAEMLANALVDKWFIGKNASNASYGSGSSIIMEYGTNADYATNTRLFEFTKHGKLIIGGGSSAGFYNGAAGLIISSGTLSIGANAFTTRGITIANIITGGASLTGLYANPTGASDGTSELRAIVVEPTTQNASYTCGAVMGIRVNDAIKGAASTITIQFGLFIDNQTQGGTNYAIFTNTGLVRFGDRVTTVASDTTSAKWNLPHGAAPSSPVNGDIWTTTAGLFVRINGTTVGPLT